MLSRIIVGITGALFFYAIGLLYNVSQERYMPGDWTPSRNLFFDYSSCYHVHSTYSKHDGGGEMKEVIAEAQRARLDFIMMTDHNTVQPFYDQWEGWYDNLLVLTGTEVSYPFGHYNYFTYSTSYFPFSENVHQLQ